MSHVQRKISVPRQNNISQNSEISITQNITKRDINELKQGQIKILQGQ